MTRRGFAAPPVSRPFRTSRGLERLRSYSPQTPATHLSRCPKMPNRFSPASRTLVQRVAAAPPARLGWAHVLAHCAARRAPLRGVTRLRLDGPGGERPTLGRCRSVDSPAVGSSSTDHDVRDD